ncbi:helix-turn-helix domain-containing protein [Achromobacter insuavis]
MGPPPGDSILDAIEDRGWTQAELAVRLSFSEKHVSQLINGRVPLSVETALKLERVIGSTADFWLARETNYQQHKARIEATQRCRSWVSWLNELPVKELMQFGAIRKQRIDTKNKPSIVDDCLKFFGVATPAEWRGHYETMQVSFRRGRTEQSDVAAISAWLRLGEQTAEKLDAPKFDRDRFEQGLKQIRGMTRRKAEEFDGELRKILQDAGVLLVLVPAIPRTHVSGVARWLGPSRPLIQLSLYGKTNDRFWFTFFHEAAHILLHANTSDEKKSVFLDDPLGAISSDPRSSRQIVGQQTGLSSEISSGPTLTSE